MKKDTNENVNMNRKKLRQNLGVLLLTIVMLSGVSLAWFINNTSPILERLNFSSASLNVIVTITDENGKPAISDGNGNAVLTAKYIKPGDSMIYKVKIQNTGAAPCKVYMGFDSIKDYKLSNGSQEPIIVQTGEKLSDYIRVSLHETLQGNIVPAEIAASFMQGLDKFYFDKVVTINAASEATYAYKVQFVGADNATPPKFTGEKPGNAYADKLMKSRFVVTATLAE